MTSTKCLARASTAFAVLFATASAMAQDLLVDGARIVDGTGRIIERGALVVRDGRIESAAATTEPRSAFRVEDVTVIDGRGMTVLPGLIDTHRHDLAAAMGQLFAVGSDEELAALVESSTRETLLSLLREGFTTVMMPAVYLSTALEIRQRLETGDLEGPRLLFTGPAFTAPGGHPAEGPVCRGNRYCADRLAIEVSDPAIARAAIGELASAGVDAIKAIVDRSLVPGHVLDEAVLGAIIDEAHEHSLSVFVHAETVDDVIAAARLGADRFVHTPLDTSIANAGGARVLLDRDIAIATTVSFSSPQFAAAVGVEHNPEPHKRALENVRHLWDEGVTVAFGTDSPPLLRPIAEATALRATLSADEILAALTANAARYLSLEDQLGTLEPGKLADLVIVEGNPLADIGALANVMVVVQGGRVVVDRR